MPSIPLGFQIDSRFLEWVEEAVMNTLAYALVAYAKSIFNSLK